MTKSICALVHRPGSTRAAFQAYYEESHALLAERHFPFTRYVRNHLIAGEDFPYDTITEFWADDISAAAALMDGPIGEIMRADEEKFMDRARIAPAGAEEHGLSAGDPAMADGARTALLVETMTGEGGWRDDLLAWGGAIASGLAGVSLDFASAWGPLGFPAAAIVWMPGHLDLQAPSPSSVRVRRLFVRRVETPPDRLMQAQTSASHEPGEWSSPAEQGSGSG